MKCVLFEWRQLKKNDTFALKYIVTLHILIYKVIKHTFVFNLLQFIIQIELLCKTLKFKDLTSATRSIQSSIFYKHINKPPKNIEKNSHFAAYWIQSLYGKQTKQIQQHDSSDNKGTVWTFKKYARSSKTHLQ